MAWTYKSPRTFPADFGRAALQAIASPESSIVIAGTTSHSNARGLAEKFRWWKWCINQRPSANQDLWEILETYDLRTTIDPGPTGYVLLLRARPKVIDLIASLNPDLRPTIREACQ